MASGFPGTRSASSTRHRNTTRCNRRRAPEALQGQRHRRRSKKLEESLRSSDRHDGRRCVCLQPRRRHGLHSCERATFETAHGTWQKLQTKAEQLRRSKGADFGLSALDSGFGFEQLASAYVGLGDKTKAFAIVKEVQAVVSASKDELALARFAATMASIAAQAGEKDLALDQLAISAQKLGGVTYGDLRLNPLWDPLRADPRFEKIVASLVPKQ
jgi:hypothetical protein